MSCLPTLPDSGNVIFSPESESGPMPCVAQDGRMTVPSGQVPVLASLSARQAKERGLLTSGTCGPRSSILSASAGLSQSLASRLQAVTVTVWPDLVSSDLEGAGWLPAGGYLRCGLPVRRISDNGSTGWPTPTGNSYTGAGLESGERAEFADGGGVIGPADTAFCGIGYSTGQSGEGVQPQDDWRHGFSGGLGNNTVRTGLEGYAGYGDGEMTAETGQISFHDRRQQRRTSLVDSRRNADWLLCRDGKRRPVEPALPAGSVGLPPEWDDCAVMVTPSSYRRRKPS